MRGEDGRGAVAALTSVHGYRLAVLRRQRSVRVRELIGRARAWLRAPEHAGLAAVTLVALAYVVIWCCYLFARHDTFKTTAEDLGIMDQALWSTIHGVFMHETICNPISDVNCLAGTMRFAIHFEPILLPLSLLYLVAPTPKLLLFLQVAVIGSGAFPAYLLALRRLRNPAWGVAFAVLLLLCPAVQSAVVDDFHPEVLAAPLLLWALYCVETKRDRGLIVACAVALLCKETLTLVVLCLGIYVIVGCGRRQVGRLLCGMALGTLVLALGIMHVTSPLGHSPVTSRFDVLLHHPFSTLLAIVGDPARHAYVAGLFAQTGFLSLLSPWMVAILAPNIAINVLSSNPNMYSGGAQYNVDLAPFLIVGAMDGIVRLRAWLPELIQWARQRGNLLAPAVVRRLADGMRRLQAALPAARQRLGYSSVAAALLVGLWCVGLQQSVRSDYHAYALDGWWPAQSAHTCLAYPLLAMIPPGASVSAQSLLVPHLSERKDIYQFPSGEDQAEYIVLDVTSGWYYPFNDTADYVAAFQQLLQSGNFELLAAQDGYLLLRRLPPALRPKLGHPLMLPATFYTFATAAPPNTSLATLARYLSEAQMFGYDTTASSAQENPAPPPAALHPPSSCQS